MITKQTRNRRRALVVRRHRVVLKEDKAEPSGSACRCGSVRGDPHDERCDRWTPITRLTLSVE
jgi:hypothetical protein